MVSVYRAQMHNVALHPDDLHHVKVRWQGQQKTLAELTPPECREVVTHCLESEQKARALLSGKELDAPPFECWSNEFRWWIFNELMQKGKLAKVLA